MKVTDFNILIENEESIDKLSIGGLTLAKNFTIPMAYGRVVQVGPGRFNTIHSKQILPEIAVGDLVVYNPGIAKPITVNVKNAEGKNFKRQVFKLEAKECILVLNEADGKICGIKSVKENYVLIKRDKTDKVTLGGIEIPELKKTINNITGTVVVTGPGKYDSQKDQRQGCFAQPGDKVAFIEMQAIKLTIPVINEKGAKTIETFYDVPDSALDVLISTDKEGNMSSLKKIKDGHILVQRDTGIKQTSTGIYLADEDKEGHLVEAKVIYLGDKLTSGVKVGDKIIYIDAKDNNKKFKLPIAGEDGKIVNQECFILPESEIEVILDENESF